MACIPPAIKRRAASFGQSALCHTIFRNSVAGPYNFVAHRGWSSPDLTNTDIDNAARSSSLYLSALERTQLSQKLSLGADLKKRAAPRSSRNLEQNTEAPLKQNSALTYTFFSPDLVPSGACYGSRIIEHKIEHTKNGGIELSPTTPKPRTPRPPIFVDDEEILSRHPLLNIPIDSIQYSSIASAGRASKARRKGYLEKSRDRLLGEEHVSTADPVPRTPDARVGGTIVSNPVIAQESSNKSRRTYTITNSTPNGFLGVGLRPLAAPCLSHHQSRSNKAIFSEFQRIAHLEAASKTVPQHHETQKREAEAGGLKRNIRAYAQQHHKICHTSTHTSQPSLVSSRISAINKCSMLNTVSVSSILAKHALGSNEAASICHLDKPLPTPPSPGRWSPGSSITNSPRRLKRQGRFLRRTNANGTEFKVEDSSDLRALPKKSPMSEGHQNYRSYKAYKASDRRFYTQDAPMTTVAATCSTPSLALSVDTVESWPLRTDVPNSPTPVGRGLECVASAAFLQPYPQRVVASGTFNQLGGRVVHVPNKVSVNADFRTKVKADFIAASSDQTCHVQNMIARFEHQECSG